MARKSPLTDKQLAFIDEYLVDLNATQAYLRAGYKCSEEVARRNSSRLLTKADIAAAIAGRQGARQERTEITQDRVLLEIARLAFNDPRKAFREDGSLLPIKDWPDEVAATIASIEVDEINGPGGSVLGYTKKVKFWDKPKNLDLAARHLGMLNDKLRVTHDIDPVKKLLNECQGTAYRPPAGSDQPRQKQPIEDRDDLDGEDEAMA